MAYRCSVLERLVSHGVSVRPAPKPVLLTLKQRRAESICVFFSVRRKREVIVRTPTYWTALWLEWSPLFARYVERPQTPEDDKKAAADFWIASGNEELLLNVEPGRERPPIVSIADPWEMDTEGLERGQSEILTVTDKWLWSRRSLLLNLERVHPFSLAAHLRGGLKATCRRVSAQLKSSGQSIGELQDRMRGDGYLALCAIFHMVHRSELSLKWDQPITLATPVERGPRAS